MQLKLFNTLTRKKEIFKPIKKDYVGIYTCGPTVYNYAHIGNLRTYLFEDILKRVLFYNKYKVKHVMNITDVGHLTSDSDTGEDKMEKGAKREKKTVWEIAEFYTKAFKEDLEKLNILFPDIWCKATEHIKEQIDWIKKLEEKGFTYKIDDGVYFDTSKFKDYGKMARLDIKNLKAGKRIEMVKGKKNKTDFALWKFSPINEKRQMEWKSPWGEKGFPGWHIECSAMSIKYLGENFDIHCGGIDHIPVHHTNEIAQVEAITERKWVNYWLHGEFLGLEKGKMAKSSENFITLQILINKGFGGLDYRYFTLNAHYRKALSFSYEALENAKNGFENLKEKILEIKRENKKGNNGNVYEKRFHNAINNDLNMPEALAILWNLIKDEKVNSKEKYKLILKFDEVFGLNLKDLKERELTDDIKELIKKREKARKEKNFELSDKIREELYKKGVSLEDKKDGVKIRLK